MNNPFLTYYPNGQIESEQWMDCSGRLHREDGPSIQEWFENGQIKSKGWVLDGRLHREDGPAFQEWWFNGQLLNESWYYKGERYRPDGPANVGWYEDGVVGYEDWYNNGKHVEMEDHPFVKLLNKYCLYSKWKCNELTEDEQILIKLSLEMS